MFMLGFKLNIEFIFQQYQQRAAVTQSSTALFGLDQTEPEGCWEITVESSELIAAQINTTLKSDSLETTLRRLKRKQNCRVSK